jgi:two-component system alkaline phosphatase synthesis response regulator PhoP
MAKVLLADDDVMLRELYQMKFEKSGHEIKLADDAETFFKFLETYQPDVLLVDRRLGDGDGIQMLPKIREQKNSKSTPIIILTNMEPTTEDVEAIKKYKGVEYLIKDKVDLNDLVARVTNLAKS